MARDQSDRLDFEDAASALIHRSGLSVIRVNQSKRSHSPNRPVKNVDLIVHADGRLLLIEVKGKSFPRRGSSSLETWIGRDDLESLFYWESLFQNEATGLILFVYRINQKLLSAGTLSTTLERCFEEILFFRGRPYAFWAVTAKDYSLNCRQRSQSWDAVDIPARGFARIRRPLSYFIPRLLREEIRDQNVCYFDGSFLHLPTGRERIATGK